MCKAFFSFNWDGNKYSRWTLMVSTYDGKDNQVIIYFNSRVSLCVWFTKWEFIQALDVQVDLFDLSIKWKKWAMRRCKNRTKIFRITPRMWHIVETNRQRSIDSLMCVDCLLFLLYLFEKLISFIMFLGKLLDFLPDINIQCFQLDAFLMGIMTYEISQ